MANQDSSADYEYETDDYDPKANTLLNESVEKVNEWYSYFNEHIERARNYLTFLYVDQWEMNIRQAREAVNKPTMEFNKLTSIIRGILGEFRNNSPALTVRGVGKEVKQEAVDLREGLIRNIHYESDADIAYQVAGRHGLECGWGSCRVIAEYESPESFNQVLRIKPIMDFQSAFWDPTATEANKLDGDYCGVYTMYSLDKFKKYYGKICPNPESVSGLTSNYYIRWNTRDTVLIAEIYYKEYYDKKLVQLSDGTEMSEEEAKEVLDMQEKSMESNPDNDLMGYVPLEIVNTREVRDYKIKHLKFVQNKILEETDYPGRILPIPYFEGDSTVIDGEQIPIPYIQDAIDTQKLINYIGSEIAYGILRSRKETVMATSDMMEGHEDDWLNPDRVQGWLEYNWDKNAGKPEFVTPPAFNPAFLSAYENATQDLMQILGRFEESRGQESNAISGRAINARQRAENKPVNLYDDNNQRGIKAIGKILLDMIPHIYDTERTVMIMSADNKSKAVDINKQNGYNMLPNGEVEPQVENDLTSGKFDIEIRVDGSYDAQQAEAMDTLIRLAAINPAIANLIPDLLAENSGLENTQQLVERLKTLVPADIIAREEGKPPPPPPPPPPPDPMVELQKQSLMIQAKKNEQDNEAKQKQLQINEQKVMIDGNKAGMQNEVTLAKAAAEIQKATIDKDIAILNHANTLTQNHST
jgi:hypothetical protein